MNIKVGDVLLMERVWDDPEKWDILCEQLHLVKVTTVCDPRDNWDFIADTLEVVVESEDRHDPDSEFTPLSWAIGTGFGYFFDDIAIKQDVL